MVISYSVEYLWTIAALTLKSRWQHMIDKKTFFHFIFKQFSVSWGRWNIFLATFFVFDQSDLVFYLLNIIGTNNQPDVLSTLFLPKFLVIQKSWDLRYGEIPIITRIMAYRMKDKHHGESLKH